MTSMASPNMVGLRLSRGALRVLKERGVFAQSCVSLEHQHFAKRYVVRGLESGGAAGSVSRSSLFLTFRPPSLFATQVSPAAASSTVAGQP
jgi:hypothetical protein